MDSQLKKNDQEVVSNGSEEFIHESDEVMERNTVIYSPIVTSSLRNAISEDLTKLAELINDNDTIQPSTQNFMVSTVINSMCHKYELHIRYYNKLLSLLNDTTLFTKEIQFVVRFSTENDALISEIGHILDLFEDNIEYHVEDLNCFLSVLEKMRDTMSSKYAELKTQLYGPHRSCCIKDCKKIIMEAVLVGDFPRLR